MGEPSKTGKVLRILGLFSDSRQHLGAADVAALLKVSLATAYRYINELTGAGFLEQDTRGSYVLGPALVRLDRLIREHDPLITAARDLMRQLSVQTGGTVLLARHVDDAVMCVAQEVGRNGPSKFSYERGRAMPLYRGSPSVVILASLPPAKLQQIVATDAQALQDAGLPVQLQALYDSLADIREQGVSYTRASVDEGVMGWSVAISGPSEVLGSLSVLLDDQTPGVHPLKIIDALRRAGLRVQARLG